MPRESGAAVTRLRSPSMTDCATVHLILPVLTDICLRLRHPTRILSFLFVLALTGVELIFFTVAGHLDPGFLAGDKTSSSNVRINEEINIASSDSEVEIVGVQEHARETLRLSMVCEERDKHSQTCNMVSSKDAKIENQDTAKSSTINPVFITKVAK
ncbi:hypothetical protein BTVI_67765 [Pitangus sulphuratus]|nr:hypothetical protein BTVI_67765 [Pitangus sulphuratus]